LNIDFLDVEADFTRVPMLGIEAFNCIGYAQRYLPRNCRQHLLELMLKIQSFDINGAFPSEFKVSSGKLIIDPLDRGVIFVKNVQYQTLSTPR
jgi:hypothetical protein